MKVYTKVVMDWDGNVIEEESYDYDGPVSQCGGSSGGGTSTTVQKADPWSGVQPYLKDAYADAASLYEAGGPEYYPGQTYVPNNPYENMGATMGLNYAMNQMPGQVGSMLQAQNDLFSAPDVANNQYVSGMADTIQNRMTRQLTEQALPQIRGGAVASGQLGGSRQGIAEGQAIGRTAEATGDALAQLYGSAYDTGLDAAGRAMQLAPQTMQAGMMPAQGVSQYGDYLRSGDELALQADMDRYNYNQMLPQQNLATYMGYLQGAPWGSTSTGTMPGQGGGFSGSGALGGAAMGASLANIAPALGPFGIPLAIGGGLLGGFF